MWSRVLYMCIYVYIYIYVLLLHHQLLNLLVLYFKSGLKWTVTCDLLLGYLV